MTRFTVRLQSQELGVSSDPECRTRSFKCSRQTRNRQVARLNGWRYGPERSITHLANMLYSEGVVRMFKNMPPTARCLRDAPCSDAASTPLKIWQTDCTRFTSALRRWLSVIYFSSPGVARQIFAETWRRAGSSGTSDDNECRPCRARLAARAVCSISLARDPAASAQPALRCDVPC